MSDKHYGLGWQLKGGPVYFTPKGRRFATVEDAKSAIVSQIEREGAFSHCVVNVFCREVVYSFSAEIAVGQYAGPADEEVV